MGTKHNGIAIIESYKNTFTKRYASVSGRASRDEYCAFLLVYYVLSLLIDVFVGVSLKWVEEYQEAILSNDTDAIARLIRSIDLGVLCIVLLMLLHLSPLIGLLVRRAHDRNISGWWIVVPCFLLLSSPLLLNILLAVLGLLPGTPGPNEYGRPPAKKDAITLTNYLLVGLLCISMCIVTL